MIVLENISKSFRENIVLNKINYHFKKGNVYQIKGESGKSVLLELVGGIIRPTSGNVIYNDKPQIGIVLEAPIFWHDMTGFESLKWLAAIKNKINDNDINNVLSRVGLLEYKDKSTNDYNEEMSHQLSLAQAIMEDPNILLIDNIINDNYYKIINEEKNKGKTIIIVSNDNLSFTDTILEIKEGELVEA